jgi:hypothetical protein
MGNKGYTTVIRASKNGRHYIVLKVPFWQNAHYLRLIEIQEQVPMAAKLLHVAESVFLLEECAGTLLWEIEDNSAFIGQLPRALDQLVASLGRVKLVHADIRPWNIFYEPTTKRFKIIDWGFSFFIGQNIHEPPFWHLRDHLRDRGHDINAPHKIDGVDAQSTLRVSKGELRYEDAWKHPTGEMEWFPSWAKR